MPDCLFLCLEKVALSDGLTSSPPSLSARVYERPPLPHWMRSLGGCFGESKAFHYAASGCTGDVTPEVALSVYVHLSPVGWQRFDFHRVFLHLHSFRLSLSILTAITISEFRATNTAPKSL